MQRLEEKSPRPARRRWGVAALSLTLALVLSGCGEEVSRGWMPEAATEASHDVIRFWNGTWIAALGIGVLMWGLILWSVFAYRRKSDDEVPAQFRYHVPLEILYTVIPVLMVATLFGKTVEVQNELTRIEENPDVTVHVAGKMWSWDFNYIDEDVHLSGVQATNLNQGEPGVMETLPRLVLPVDSRVEFILTSRDVIHSFWVINFHTKLDMIPGRVNTMQVTTTEEGIFQGKCAELCGAYHSEMLFQVEVVSQDEYEQHIEALRAAGNTGLIGLENDRYELQPDQYAKLPEGMRN